MNGYFDSVANNNETLIIKRNNGKDAVMISLDGLLPKNQAGNLIVASSLLPCLGGKNSINLLMSPRLTASKALEISLWCQLTQHH